MSEQAQNMVNAETGTFDDRFATENLGISYDLTHCVYLRGYGEPETTRKSCFFLTLLCFLVDSHDASHLANQTTERAKPRRFGWQSSTVAA